MAMSSRIREIPSTKIGDAVAEYHIWDIARLQSLYASKTGKEDIIIEKSSILEITLSVFVFDEFCSSLSFSEIPAKFLPEISSKDSNILSILDDNCSKSYE